MTRPMMLMFMICAACSGADRNDAPDFSVGPMPDLSATGVDQAKAGGGLVINEVYPSGADPLTDPDWVELKNTSGGPISLKAYTLADSSKVDVPLPDVVVTPGGYALVLCDDAPDAGASSTIHVPFKLKVGGDEVHLKSGSGDDSTTWKKDEIPATKSWARLPDGTGAFVAATPTKLATNAP